MIHKKSLGILAITVLIAMLPFMAVPQVKAQTDYWVYRFLGPAYDTGAFANTTDSVTCNMRWINGSIYTFNIGSDSGEILSIYEAVQISWNASSLLNYTRFIDFTPSFNNTAITLFIPDPSEPAYIYTFPVTDFYGMTNPYLTTSISSNGVNQFTVEQVNLEAIGTPSFTLQQYRTYTLTFTCSQGTYAQQFTAENIFTNTLSVLASAFSTNATGTLVASANRTTATSITVGYSDPNSTTTWIYVELFHRSGSTTITDYTTNQTANSYTTTLTVSSSTDYYVEISALRSGEVVTYRFACPAPITTTNPFTALFDFLGTWPDGIDPAQLIPVAIILCALSIGSFRSTGLSCILALIIGGVLIALGWFTASIPMFALAGLLGFIIAIQEAKDQSRDG